MISAPCERVPSTLIEGASDGMTIVAGMPSRSAAMATPWAWLPDEKATTPARLSAFVNNISRLVAPRSLKAPPVCRHSHFSHTPAPAMCDATRGVCSTSSSIRAAAATTASRVTSDAKVQLLDIATVSPKRCHLGTDCRRTALRNPLRLYSGDPRTYIAPRCPMGLPTARQLCVELPVGG